MLQLGRTGAPSGRVLRRAWTAPSNARCQAWASSSFSQPYSAGDEADMWAAKAQVRASTVPVRPRGSLEEPGPWVYRAVHPASAGLQLERKHGDGLASVRSSRPRMWDLGQRSRNANSWALWLRPAAMLHSVLVCLSFTVNSRRLMAPTAQLPDSGHT